MNTEKNFFHFPFFIAPKSDVFTERAIRFEELAQADTQQWQDYLRLLAQVSHAQQRVLNGLVAALPPLNSEPEQTVLPENDGKNLPEHFFTALQQLCTVLATEKLPETAQSSLKTLAAFSESQARETAQRMLQDNMSDNEKNLQLWLTAALQCAWTAWSIQLGEDDVPVRENRNNCPACGGDAVSSLIQNGGDLDGLRYLHCGSCNGQWHALRAKCTFCGDQSALTRHSIADTDHPALKGASAEYCGKCQAYRKIHNRQQQQHADPVADDLASLALDILMGEENKPRGGRNPFFIG